MVVPRVTHANSDLRALNVYANTLYLENLAIGEVVQGLNEVLNTNNEASNNIIVSNLEPATSVTTGALRCRAASRRRETCTRTPYTPPISSRRRMN